MIIKNRQVTWSKQHKETDYMSWKLSLTSVHKSLSSKTRERFCSDSSMFNRRLTYHIW